MIPRFGIGAEPRGCAARARERGVSRVGIFGGLLLAAVLGYVVVQSLRLEAAICEVCMEYRGRSQCRTVGGASEEEARTAAITNACAFLSSGVTDSMACQRTPPSSASCR